MFNHADEYTLRTEGEGVNKRYFASFLNGDGEKTEVEVSRKIALVLFLEFVRTERNITRWDERHKELIVLTDEELDRRILHKPLPIDEMAVRAIAYEQLHRAIATLSQTQKRRVMLYYFENLTLEQIAERENCKYQSVQDTLNLAEEKIKKFFQK